jgi:hypothetical protein
VQTLFLSLLDSEDDFGVSPFVECRYPFGLSHKMFKDGRHGRSLFWPGSRQIRNGQDSDLIARPEQLSMCVARLSHTVVMGAVERMGLPCAAQRAEPAGP